MAGLLCCCVVTAARWAFFLSAIHDDCHNAGPDIRFPTMSNTLVADPATTRLINWVLGVGSVVTGGLLLWIGSQTYSTSVNTAVMAQQVTTIVQTVEENGDEIGEARSEIRQNTRSIDGLSQRVDKLEQHGNQD